MWVSFFRALEIGSSKQVHRFPLTGVRGQVQPAASLSLIKGYYMSRGVNMGDACNIFSLMSVTAVAPFQACRESQDI